MKMTNKEVVYSFIAAINGHDTDRIYNLMSEDHVFIDGYGNRCKGRKEMKNGWIKYFEMFPDYLIEITDYAENETMSGLFGFAGATFKNKKNESNSNYWRIPAALKAIVKDGKIKYWQVFCDYSRLLKIIETNQID